ncbi:hypothetical protein SAMN02745673_00850 [Marinactinospora thermotolerans DSM 45154]|uniref:Uncharacterized protein n=1 Tax=Marinactinospora thermotolerans DSM 45154 TaxID=1122192 RepID=A0A1T4LWS5_9ACTN|nr:hypothetical protein SAMN02745673_00850 [Marinactinospora thermotolerans DSM 45154]
MTVDADVTVPGIGALGPGNGSARAEAGPGLKGRGGHTRDQGPPATHLGGLGLLDEAAARAGTGRSTARGHVQREARAGHRREHATVLTGRSGERHATGHDR